jgi:hypothetical protein
MHKGANQKLIVPEFSGFNLQEFFPELIFRGKIPEFSPFNLLKHDNQK